MDTADPALASVGKTQRSDLNVDLLGTHAIAGSIAIYMVASGALGDRSAPGFAATVNKHHSDVVRFETRH